MAETDWRKVVDGLLLRSAEPTQEQRDIASALVISLDPGTPELVASALLRTHLAKPLGLTGTPLIGDSEYAYLKRVAAETDMRIPAEIGTRELLDAWIQVAWAKRSVSHLERLRPAAGDVVVVAERWRTERVRYGEISSISVDGRLNFRGGYGRGARPHCVERIVRTGESDYADLARKAREEAVSHNPHPERVTNSDLALLAPWKVTRQPSLADREAFREALVGATEERPMQVALEKHPSLLTNAIMGGSHGVWVRPQVQFGNRYMADFLIAILNSAGLHWILVELESPTHRLTNSGNGRASPALRHAVDQIEDWREWIKPNLLSARAPRENGGLGLPGITEDARGLILIGRESASDDAKEFRNLRSSRDRIEVRTYDSLLRVAEGEAPMILGYSDD
ncbi:DUF4263 domain-containing protein [Nocardiopsis sp. N85]|uniref:Shedu anti-phage system protein SduA domain-containing protein n=1 Tax=Nocardiopsis sp. N85 TaxID=3029400 RepID=UPI00237F7AC3|nr:Shedu anti-phage system protein SduA domain-containing protein [Nocardiopsis sp. N85]MDE3721382.1 DUF4263 domain-containing protein [Nocardiopsis sp. N85]